MRRGRLHVALGGAIGAALAIGGGCGDGAQPSAPDAGFDRVDPEGCKGCHADHYGGWASSMHAYATDDPVFIAMNARAQRETGGAIGTFCVKCHAPMAVALGATDGRDLANVPRALRGVTCTFCHSVDATLALHNGAVHLAEDGAMRGPIEGAMATEAHPSAYSSLHDRATRESATLCGSCHDVENTDGVAIERTYAEWSASFAPAEPKGQCGHCHMPETDGTAASLPGAPARRVHDHAMVGIDVPRDATPEQRRAVQQSLGPALIAKLCVTAPGHVRAMVANARIGHAWPSGAAQNRRAWLEIVAYAGGAEVFRSGVVDGAVKAGDSALLLRDTMFDREGNEVLFMWQAARVASSALVPRAPGEAAAHEAWSDFDVPAAADRVTMRVQARPMALEIVDALIASGDLEPGFRDAIPVYTLTSTSIEWTRERGDACLP